MRKFGPKLAAAAAFLSTAMAASATPLAYDEAVSGDLPDAVMTGYRFFAVDVGVNTLRGTISAGAVRDADSFSFTVPAGQTLQTFDITLNDVSGNITQAVWAFYVGGPSGEPAGYFDVLSPGSVSLAAFAQGTLGPGLYSFRQASVTPDFTIDPPITQTAAYQFAITVVPEPACIGVFAAMTVALRRRRIDSSSWPTRAR